MPRYAYTIGLRESAGFELVLGGAAWYTAKQVHRVMNFAGATLREDPNVKAITVPSLGSFDFRGVHDSWIRRLAFGVLDYYKMDGVPARQIVPDHARITIDTPDMGNEYNVEREPAWRWIDEDWSYPVAHESIVTTNINALRGSPITELARWEDALWEMFAGPGPDVATDEMRVTPLGVLLGKDPSLGVALDLPVGEGYWRQNINDDWHQWRKRGFVEE